MVCIIIFLSMIVIGFFLYIVRLKKGIRNIEEQICDIKDMDTNAIIRNESGITMLNQLVYENNELLTACRKKCIHSENAGRQLKENIMAISHDLRTPLTAAGGYVDLIKRDDVTDEERAQYIRIIEERQDTVRMLVDQLFYYTRLEDGHMVWHEEEIDIRKILLSVLAMYYGEFEAKQEEPSIRIEDRQMKLLGDRDAVTRIFSNIISNGLRYGNGDYAILLSTVQDGYQFAFSNRTEHMSEESAKHVFEMHYTHDKARSKAGTGLGLSIAKSLVEQMKGTITAVYGEGIFTIRIFYRQ